MPVSSKFCIIFALLVVLGLHGQAQEITIDGKFNKDTAMTGEPIDYHLLIKYPKSINLILPDSLAAFSGMEYISRSYEPTSSDSAFSYDRIRYSFRSFVPDTTIIFSMPVYWLQANDSINLFASPDTLTISTILPPPPATDTLAFAADNSLVAVEKQFNYPYFLIGLLVLLVFIAIIIFVFGNGILAQLKAYQLGIRHRKFKKAFAMSLEKVKDGSSSARGPYLIWKTYLEKLENRPYTKLTSAEIATIDTENRNLLEVFHSLDMVAYGYETNSEKSLDDLGKLGQAADNRFLKKKDEVLHA